MSKKVGKWFDVDVIEDPNAPPGMIYLINGKRLEFASIDARSRWQRVKDWFKRLWTKRS